MNLTGLRYYARARFFSDERGTNLEEAVLVPVGDPVEMGGNPARLPERLAALPYYAELFRRAFGDPVITEQRIGRALAQFLRSLVSYRSRFDEGMARAPSPDADFANFTRLENRGKALFERNCATCHSEVDEAPFALLFPSNNGSELDPRSADGGLGDITLNALDSGRFKSPTLRNVEVAGPYMHNGSLTTLDDVVEHYSRSFHRHPNLDIRMFPLNFTVSEKTALVAFLRTLTDRAFLTDPRFSDPFDPPVRSPPPVAPLAAASHTKAPLPPRGDVEAVTARVMAFDADRDARVSSVELPHRMQDIVKRGDRNGDALLDREEVRTIVSSSVVIGSGIGIPPLRPLDVPRDVRITVRIPKDPGLAGLIDDLKLPPDRRARAIAALAQADADTANAVAASLDTFRGEVHPLLTQQQSTAMEQQLQDHSRSIRKLLGEMAAPCCRPSIPGLPRFDLSAFGLTGEALANARAALDRHLERMRELATDRSLVLRRVTPVLTPEELADFAASLERHRAIITEPVP
jgi:hypothetical protein